MQRRQGMPRASYGMSVDPHTMACQRQIVTGQIQMG